MSYVLFMFFEDRRWLCLRTIAFSHFVHHRSQWTNVYRVDAWLALCWQMFRRFVHRFNHMLGEDVRAHQHSSIHPASSMRRHHSRLSSSIRVACRQAGRQAATNTLTHGEKKNRNNKHKENFGERNKRKNERMEERKKRRKITHTHVCARRTRIKTSTM